MPTNPESPWPFEDATNTAVITVADVLSGAKPVLQVSHDVSDGGWQFLTGEDVDIADAKVVCLAEVVDTDPTLLALADLPLGCLAERRDVASVWTRSAMVPTTWEALLDESHAYTQREQARLTADFSLLAWERWDYHQERAELVFSTAGAPRLVTTIRIVGSLSSNTGTWLWSWANASILEAATEGVELLRRFGEQHGLEKLTKPRWGADEIDGWEMTSVVCFLLGGDGVYRAPDEDGSVFMVLTKPRLLAPTG